MQHDLFAPPRQAELISKLSGRVLYVPDDSNFIYGLNKLANIIKSMYFDMIHSPAEYGLSLVDDTQYEKSNSKAQGSKNSVHRLVTIDYINDIVKSSRFRQVGSYIFICHMTAVHIQCLKIIYAVLAVDIL